jgi:hypothetical protein
MIMAKFELTVEDRELLTEACGLYWHDWREDDADEKTAGWRSPKYFVKPYDFTKLVEAGLMEKGDASNFITYRISEAGMEVAQAPTAASAETGSGDVSGADERSVWSLDIAELRLAVEQLETENESQARKIATLEAALKPFADLYGKWVNRLLVDQYFPEWLEIHLTVMEQQGHYTRQLFEAAHTALDAGNGEGA